MNALAPLLVGLLSGDIAAAARRARRNAILYGVALLFILTAYAATVVGVVMLVARDHGAPEATFMAAAAMAATALVVFAVTAVMNRRDTRRRAQGAAGRAALITAGVAMLPMLIRSRALIALAAAGGAGVVGASLLKKSPRASSRIHD